MKRPLFFSLMALSAVLRVEAQEAIHDTSSNVKFGRSSEAKDKGTRDALGKLDKTAGSRRRHGDALRRSGVGSRFRSQEQAARTGAASQHVSGCTPRTHISHRSARDLSHGCAAGSIMAISSP